LIVPIEKRHRFPDRWRLGLQLLNDIRNLRVGPRRVNPPFCSFLFDAAAGKALPRLDVSHNGKIMQNKSSFQNIWIQKCKWDKAEITIQNHFSDHVASFEGGQ